MLPALSEPIALPPGALMRLDHVAQTASDPLPEAFLHFHDLAELVFIENGSGTCFTETGGLPFGPGTILYVPPMALHDFEFDAGPRQWTLVQFDALASDPDRTILPRQSLGAQLGSDSQARLRLLLDWLSDMAATKSSAPDSLIVLRALLVAVKAAVDTAEAPAPVVASPISRFRPFLQQVMDQPDRVLSLTEAATLCRVSAPYFSKIFRDSFGCGFNVYQNQLRLQHAARMLATRQEPISQIGYRVGFQSHAYFSKRFKALFGMSPTRFQKAQFNRPT